MPPTRRRAAVIAAAGRGERLGPSSPGGLGASPGEAPAARPAQAAGKAFVELGGKPLVGYALETIRDCREFDEVVVVVAPPDVERARRLFLVEASAPGAEAQAGWPTIRVVAGGDQRQASVRAALAEVSPGCEFVLVHDAARPFVRPELIRRCLEAAERCGAAVAALPATDTVKQVSPAGEVAATLDRSRLWLVQTPQAFRYRLLLEAHEAAAEAGFVGTDDSSLVERMGHPVHLVPGDPENVKITWPEDLERAERRLSQSRDSRSREPEFRSGIGYDVHAFAVGRPLVLGGVRFAGERGLLGHSDADVVCHAICDALLGAAGAGDIGQHFPDSDPRYAGVSSLSLLARVAEMARGAGWEIENVDAVVIAEAPRIADRVPEMCQALAGAMGLDPARVSVKGKTSEGLGFTGRGEGIASQAVALLRASHHRRTHGEGEE